MPPPRQHTAERQALPHPRERRAPPRGRRRRLRPQHHLHLAGQQQLEDAGLGGALSALGALFNPLHCGHARPTALPILLPLILLLLHLLLLLLLLLLLWLRAESLQLRKAQIDK